MMWVLNKLVSMRWFPYQRVWLDNERYCGEENCFIWTSVHVIIISDWKRVSKRTVYNLLTGLLWFHCLWKWPCLHCTFDRISVSTEQSVILEAMCKIISESKHLERIQFIDFSLIHLPYDLKVSSKFCFEYELGIRCGRVVSVGDFKPGVPGSIPSRGTTVMVECPLARHIF